MDKYFPKKKGINTDNLKITDIGKFSITFPTEADEITNIISKQFKTPGDIVITDATACVGGNSINFANNFAHVNSVEVSPLECETLKNNIKVYGLQNKISVHCADYLTIKDKLVQHVIFFDPPWGGPGYRYKKRLNMNLSGIDIVQVISTLLKKAKLIVVKAPSNYNISRLITNLSVKKISIYKLEKYNVITISPKNDK
jgi:16S rRNA G966 N2-methylase RsmD